MSRLFLCAGLMLLALTVLMSPPAHAQVVAPCGVVDAIDFPIDISDTIARGYDDFGLFRARFGGNHTAVDIGFNRWGEPVHAAMRGLVTYADPEGWDTEKGVVILQHTFPDGSIAYSVYGHMEQSETILFPPVGTCVERGAIIGGIGWPSRGRPHLHYEIRKMLPDDGGPGYVTDNPILEGWYHPLDFTQTWRVRLQPGFISALSFDEAPSIPLVLLDSGMAVLARGDKLIGVVPPDTIAWQLTTDGIVTGLAALPGDRAVAYTRNGQAITLQAGRYTALWNIKGPEASFVAVGETLVFIGAGGDLEAYNAGGEPLWTLPGNGVEPDRIFHFESSGEQIALAVREAGQVVLRLIDASGALLYETTFDAPPVIAPGVNGSWFVLSGAQLSRIRDGQWQTLGSTGLTHGRTARMTVDNVGNSYIYLGDGETTLLSLGAAGEPRWRVRYPLAASTLAPLLDTGGGCMLYTLDPDGMFNIFNTATGELVKQTPLYAGGTHNSSPLARLLRVDASERVEVSSGFLSVLTLDGNVFSGDVAKNCLLG